MNFGPYTVQRYTEARGFGMENTPSSADLYRDGKKIGTIRDDGNGGETHVDVSSVERKRLCDYIATLPPEPNPYDEKSPFKVCEDLFAGCLLEEAGARKVRTAAVKRRAKKGHPFTAFFVAPFVESLISAPTLPALNAAIDKNRKKGEAVIVGSLRGSSVVWEAR